MTGKLTFKGDEYMYLCEEAPTSFTSTKITIIGEVITKSGLKNLTFLYQYNFMTLNKDNIEGVIIKKLTTMWNDLTVCKHLVKHTELLRQMYLDTPAQIITICADCGEKIKTIDVKGV